MEILFKINPLTTAVSGQFFFKKDWRLPVPRKGETVLLYVPYTGQREGMRFTEWGTNVLCIFMVDRVTYREVETNVIIDLTYVTPYTGD